MSSIYSWSENADDNDDADVAINWQENQQPDTVNNSARAMMGRVAEYVADQGTQTVGGTANAMTLTANSAFTAYANGLRLTIKAASTNTGATTLNVNSLGNKAIRKVLRGASDAALAAGDIQEDGVYELIYDSDANSAAGAWIVINPALGTLSTASSPLAVASGGTGVATAALAMDAFGATRTLTAGTGLTGGGTLAADRTISLDVPVTVARGGTGSTSAADARTALAVPPETRSISAGTGLTGGGTLAADRTISLSTPVAIANGGTGAATASAARTALSVPPDSRTITAGNGLTGGGDLSANRTLTLGTPGTLSLSSTNSVSAVTHTHELSGVAGLDLTNDSAETDFEIGHIIVMVTNEISNRNTSTTPALHNASNQIYVHTDDAAAGDALDGTWRSRGSTGSGMIAQRVA